MTQRQNAKLEDTIGLLRQADKLRDKGGKSDFLRNVVEGACDEILQTPVNSIDKILPPGAKEPNMPDIGCELAMICTEFPHGCEDCPHAVERTDWKEEFVKQQERAKREAENAGE